MKLELIKRPDLQVFAYADITDITITTFNKLSDEDTQGHEKFSSMQEMYAYYTNAYNLPIGPDTQVKIIKFRITQV